MQGLEALDEIVEMLLERKSKILKRGSFTSLTKGWKAGQMFNLIWDKEDIDETLDAFSKIRKTSGDSKSVAKDESYWREIQQGYTADRGIINLNNGGVSPSPSVVQEALKRHLDFSNTSPAYTMWRILEPQKETVRRRLARFFGSDAEEIAITRNASEGLQICQNGFDLEPGDEVLTTTQDYGRMISTFKQRE